MRTLTPDGEIPVTMSITQYEQLPAALRSQLEIHIPWIHGPWVMYSLPAPLATAIKAHIEPPSTPVDGWRQLSLLADR